MKYFLLPALIAASSYTSTTAIADTNTEIELLKQNLELLRNTYEQRIQQLEQKLSALADKQVRQQPVATTNVVPEQRNVERQNAFNPGISAILIGRLNSYSRDPQSYRLPGFQLGEESGLSNEGFSADETEITLSADIDDKFYGSVTFAFEQTETETEIELEEAYLESTALGNGFAIKAGRFYSNIGYLNKQHSHRWDFSDQPLAYRAFLGDQYSDDGVQLRWVAPTDTFLEIGAEYLRGARFPAAGADNNGKGAYSLFAQLGGDIGDSYRWRTGLSRLWAQARDRGSDDDNVLFNGDSNLWIADAVLKWAPNGNPTQRNVTLQAEIFSRHERGNIDIAEPAQTAVYRGTQRGGYVQAVYQFQPRWRLGARYDKLFSNNRANDNSTLALAGLEDDYDPTRSSLMLDYSRNEFNRLRIQYNRDRSRQRVTDNQFTLQYIVSFGAHGGHEF